MTQRYTRADVVGMLGRAQRAAQTVGIPGTDRWEIQQGSPTYGLAWRLHRRGDINGNGSGLYGALPGMDSYIGWSAREAYQTLHAMAQAWEAVMDTRN